jgi:hypothetical protein
LYYGRVDQLIVLQILNVVGGILIKAKEEKGYTYPLTKEDVRQYQEKYQELLFKESLTFWGEERAYHILNRIKPAEMPFSELQQIVRRGLDVVIEVSQKELLSFAQGIINTSAPNDRFILQINGNSQRFLEAAKEALNQPEAQRMIKAGGFRQLATVHVKKMAERNEKLTKSHLAGKLGISRETLYNYLEDDPSLWNDLQKIYIQTRISLNEQEE